MVRIISTDGLGGYYRDGADGIAYDGVSQPKPKSQPKPISPPQEVPKTKKRKRKPKTPPPPPKAPEPKRVSGGYTARFY